MRLRSLTLAAAGLALTTSLAFAETFTGTVSDTMCGKKHMMPGVGDAKCVQECIKDGADYALVIGDKVYTLKGDKTQLNKLAGAKVVVDGQLSGDTVTAKSITPAK
jgi:hypothetical protein